MRKLYSHPRSGNSHKVRMLLAFLRLDCEEVTVDVPNGGHRTPDFLRLNPLGQVPVFVEDGATLRDSQAILVYLARRYGAEDWFPSEPLSMAKVMQWLSTAANEIHHGPYLARRHHWRGPVADIEAVIERTHAILQVIEDHLSSREWLETGRPTIADIACFPYVGLAPEGNVSLETYPNIRAWIARIKALPGYVGMPGLEP